MARRGRPVWGAVFGLVFGIALTVDLLFFGTFGLESVMLWILPIVFLVIGAVLGYIAPLQLVMRRWQSGGAAER